MSLIFYDGSPVYDLPALGSRLYSQYIAQKPFPHIVIDNAINPSTIKKIISEFPDISGLPNRQYYSDAANEKFASARGEHFLGEHTKNLLRFFNSSSFIDFLNHLTGINEPLIPDPHYVGGGLHEIKKGGFLKMHCDFAKHPETNLDRRINLILYLNHNWHDQYGGHLQLMDYSSGIITSKILPIANRMVIFSTNDFTFHGHPDPLPCPSSLTRKSLALYYFSNGRPSCEIKRKGGNTVETIYKARIGESLGLRYRVKSIARLFTPPIAYTVKDKILDFLS